MKSLIERYGKVNLIMVGVTIVTTVIAIIMGIYAVQTAMKMKLSFNVNPAIKVAILDNSQNVIFNNNGQGVIAEGVNLSGNELTFNESIVADLGAEITITIQNHNAEKMLTRISGATASLASNTSTSMQEFVLNPGATSQQIKVSGLSTATLQFDKVIQVTIPTQAGFTFNAGGSSVVKVGNTYYQPLSKDLQASFTLNTTDYKDHAITAKDMSSGDYSWDTSTGVFTIPAANLTKDVELALSSTANLPYTIGSYTTSYADYGLSAAPTTDGTELADGVVYHSQFDGYKYIELGEYPQSLYSTEATLNGVPGTLGATTTLGGERYYYQTKVNYGTAGWYKFEPIRWIIIGAGSNETATYGAGANVKVQGELDADQLLLLSEYGLEKHVFHNSYMNQFANSDLKTFLNGTFAKRSGLNIHIQSDLIATVTPKTTYADINKNEQYDEGSSYNIFCLGYSNGSDATTKPDTYDVRKYLNSDNARKAIATGFAQTSGVYANSNNYCYWWLRSGISTYSSNAFVVYDLGNVYGNYVNYSNPAVRPSFVLNLSA